MGTLKLTKPMSADRKRAVLRSAGRTLRRAPATKPVQAGGEARAPATNPVPVQAGGESWAPLPDEKESTGRKEQRELLLKGARRVFGTPLPPIAARLESSAPLPFAIGIHAAAAAAYPAVNRAKLVRWCAAVVRTNAYREALAEDGAQRYGLDALPVGPVSAEHRDRARGYLSRYRASRKRKAARRRERAASVEGVSDGG